MTVPASVPPRRPVLRYHGGKWKLASWILTHLPPHRCYVEPYGGAASVLMQKTRSYAEVYNDLDDDVVNLFRVLRDPRAAARLRRVVALTPFARQEFRASYRRARTTVGRARAMIIRAFMGFGSASMTRVHVTGFRFNANRSGTTPAQDWAGWPAHVPAMVERLRGVIVEQQPALKVIRQFDGLETLFYVDPPYPHETRSSVTGRGNAGKHYCRHEMTTVDHRVLAAALHQVQGMVLISSYPSPLYDADLYADWHRVERLALADGARMRTEVLYLNAACCSALRRERLQLDL